MKMYKKLSAVLIGALLGLGQIDLIQADTAGAITKLTAHIEPGSLMMTTPNDLEFIAMLDGKQQSIELDTVSTKISDYRGIGSGWRIAVKSPNHAVYRNNYQLMINDKPITGEGVVIYNSKKQIRNKIVSLKTMVNISNDAEAGAYHADLDWILEPDNNVKE